MQVLNVTNATVTVAQAIASPRRSCCRRRASNSKRPRRLRRREADSAARDLAAFSFRRSASARAQRQHDVHPQAGSRDGTRYPTARSRTARGPGTRNQEATHAPNPPHRHGRVLRVGRAARQSGAEGQTGRRRWRSRPSAASSRRRATRRARSACGRRSRCRVPCGCAPRWSSCARTFRSIAGCREQVFAIYRERDAARRAAVARRGVSRRDGERVAGAARRHRRQADQADRSSRRRA